MPWSIDAMDEKANSQMILTFLYGFIMVCEYFE